MRVLCLSGYSHSSHHRKIELLADAPGLEILHILQPGNGKEAGWHPSANGQRRYRVEIVPLRSLGRPGDPHRTIHWPPRFFLKEFKPDIIHCEHEQESLMAVEVALARQLIAPQTPLILYSWQNILRQRSLPVRAVSQFTLWVAQHIVCASTESAAVLTNQGFEGSISIAPLFGLDTRYFYPKPTSDLRQQFNLTGFVVGYIGRLVAEKGIDTLLYATTRAKNQPQVLIIGDGPEKNRLQALSQELGLTNYCHFVSHVVYETIVDYMNLINLLILPSRTTPHWKEQFGRVLVEAMACKIPVAGSDSGAIAEVIDDPERIFPEGNVAALAQIIDTLAGNSELAQYLGEQQYRRVITHYTVERLAEKTLAVWQQLSNKQPV